MHLIQFETQSGQRQVGAVDGDGDGDRLDVVRNTQSTRELALAAIRGQRSLQDEVASRGTEPGPDFRALLQTPRSCRRWITKTRPIA